MATIDQLNWSSLTAAVNEIQAPSRFLRRAVFRRTETKPTETIELSTYVRNREMAPFVLKDGEAVQVKGHSTTFATVEAPNIRIKHPMTPADFLYKRRPASPIFVGAGNIRSAINEHIAKDLQAMVAQVEEREEYMCAQLLSTGVIDYQNESTGANFQITYPRDTTDATYKTIWTTPPSGTFWDGTAADRRIINDIHRAKRITNYHHQLNPTIAICGSEVSDVLMSQLVDNPNFIQAAMDTRDVVVGGLNLTNFFDDDGVIPIGRLGGLPIVEYSRQVFDQDGSSAIDMIDPKWIHFVCAQPAAEHTIYYGAIADNKTFRGGFQTKRFAKSWEEEDPSSIIALLQSRPLPCLRRPNTIVSMKVVSG